jgi:hypothetical protein
MSLTPIPEPRFFFRRIFAFGSALIALGLVALIVWRLDDPAYLTAIALVLIAANLWNSTLYMQAPTKEFVAQIAAIVEAARGGTS